MKRFKFNTKSESSIVGKAIEQNITGFSDDEIERVYKECVAPNVCKKVLYGLIERGLKFEHLKNEFFEFDF